MEVLNLEVLAAFSKKHPLARKPLSRWLELTGFAQWNSVTDVQKNFKTAEDVKGYVVFNIHGNAYRLIAVIRYPKKQVIVHEALTHAEYDRWKP
jgi:mRNA interferase HigB